jgi:hypothetical protein
LLCEDPDGIRIVANFLPGKGYLADAGKAQESESRFAFGECCPLMAASTQSRLPAT